MMLARFLAALCSASFAVAAHAQQPRDTIRLPDVPGYRTLKGDFHLHTVFSDGQVWPSFRVQEANRDGLDFIALTDHTDYQGNPDALGKDPDRPYDIAVAAAKGSRLIVLKGAEISPRTPPYHANAIFLTDASKIPAGYMQDTRGRFLMKEHPSRAELIAPFLAAREQGAFITYNHPAYLYDWDPKTMGADLFTGFHRELLANGMLHGIEVVNGNRYYKKAHALAMQHGLTLMAGSDEHADIAATYREWRRPMTLVFAKEASAGGIREALLARRTAIYFKDYLIGRQREIEPFFRASLEITTRDTTRNAEPLLLIHIHNRSDIPYNIRATGKYDFDTLPLGRTVLAPHTTTTLLLRTLWDFPPEVTILMSVENLLTGPEENLHSTIELNHDWKRRP